MWPPSDSAKELKLILTICVNTLKENIFHQGYLLKKDLKFIMLRTAFDFYFINGNCFSNVEQKYIDYQIKPLIHL